MFDSARRVISGALGVAAVLLVLWVIGVATAKGPAPAGLTAVGAGIRAVIGGFAAVVHGL